MDPHNSLHFLAKEISFVLFFSYNCASISFHVLGCCRFCLVEDRISASHSIE